MSADTFYIPFSNLFTAHNVFPFFTGFHSLMPVYTQTTIGGLYGLLEDILALLPQDEIFILFFEKLDSSIEFSNMVESIGSQEFGMKFDSLKVRILRVYLLTIPAEQSITQPI